MLATGIGSTVAVVTPANSYEFEEDAHPTTALNYPILPKDEMDKA